VNAMGEVKPEVNTRVRSANSEPVSLYIEGVKFDPDALDHDCPICQTEPGVWCATLQCGVPQLIGQRIGIVHKAREEAPR